MFSNDGTLVTLPAKNTNNANLLESKQYLKTLYLQDNRPWVVAFSGGKDSTLVLQLVCEMLLELGGQANKKVFVISSDTRVEAPNVSAYLSQVIQAIREYARNSKLDLETHLVKPKVEQTFWSKLIGHGYPSPTRWFRWCTTNMKIKPTKKLIKHITDQFGSVVLLLGTRIDESSSRSSRIKAREYTHQGLNPHHEIPNALVATPIVNWTTDEVWEYLTENNPPPWGMSHDFLLSLYRQAAGGECPVVFDLSTPSCGGSRFGCWTCTVVKEDKSMQGFVETGEEQFAPLLHFRNHLKAIREDLTKRSKYRKDGSKGSGPFLPETRQALLGDLFALEQEIGEELISDEEIAYIQQQWSAEFDLKNSALSLAEKYGRKVENMPQVTLPKLDQQVLEEILAESDMDPELVDKLLNLVLDKHPDMSIQGSKTALERDVEQTIEAAAANIEAGENPA